MILKNLPHSLTKFKKINKIINLIIRIRMITSIKIKIILNNLFKIV